MKFLPSASGFDYATLSGPLVIGALPSCLTVDSPSSMPVQTEPGCVSPQNYTKAMRLFVGEPVWKAYNRPADEFEIRQKYIASLQTA